MTFGMKDWGCDYPTSSELTNTFIQAGGNFIDTADMYSNGISEELVGKAIAAHRRDDLVIATKGWFRMGKTPNNKGLSRKHIMEAANASLQRLGTDYIDLYQMHGPDPHTPIEDLPPEQYTRLANVVPFALGYPREWIEITKSNTTGHE